MAAEPSAVGGAEPRMAAALPRIIAIEKRCHSHVVCRWSPVTDVCMRPSSLMNLLVSGPMTPDVSTARGVNRYCDERL